MKFSGTEAGAVFGTTAVASLVSPFFVGLVADRFFSTERVLAVLYALGAFLMLVAMRVTTFTSVSSTRIRRRRRVCAAPRRGSSRS